MHQLSSFLQGPLKASESQSITTPCKATSCGELVHKIDRFYLPIFNCRPIASTILLGIKYALQSLPTSQQLQVSLRGWQVSTFADQPLRRPWASDLMNLLPGGQF